MFARQNAMSFRGTVKTVPYARNKIFRVGRGDSPVRGNVCEADKRVPEFGEFCPRRFHPSERGLSNAQHLTGGEKQADISSLPPSFAYGKSHLPPRGRNIRIAATPPNKNLYPRRKLHISAFLPVQICTGVFRTFPKFCIQKICFIPCFFAD